MKSIKMFGKSVPLLAIVVISLLAIGAGAVLLTEYGSISGTATVKQAVLVDDKGVGDPIVEVFGDVTGGDTVCIPHYLENLATIPAPVSFGTAITPAVHGITVMYQGQVEYSYEESIQVDDSASYLELTVTDDGDSVTWTFDFPVEEFTGDGNLNVGLIIALDGEGEGPAFQIHNTDSNDMTLDGTIPLLAGTWAVSPWGPTIGDGWNGWHGDMNTLVTDLTWVEASGNRNVPHGDGVLTVSISRAVLGCEFHWAASPTVGSGFSGIQDVTMQVPTDFGWGTPLVNMGVPNYIYADLYEEIIEPLTLESGVVFDFMICYTFPINLAGDYTITTTVDVA